MLNIKDVIRVERDKTDRYNILIFKCSNCSNEIRTRKTFLKLHPGICRSCSCKKTIKIAQLSNRLRPFEAKYNIFKYKCPETDISYDDYLEFTKIPNCHYCEQTMPWQPFGENNPGFWLDRKDNNLGHLNGNLVVCCGVCNKTKRDEFTYEEFLQLAPVLKKIRENRNK